MSLSNEQLADLWATWLAEKRKATDSHAQWHDEYKERRGTLCGVYLECPWCQADCEPPSTTGALCDAADRQQEADHRRECGRNPCFWTADHRCCNDWWSFGCACEECTRAARC